MNRIAISCAAIAASLIVIAGCGGAGSPFTKNPRVRVVHAFSDQGNLDALVEGVIMLDDAAFASISDFKIVANDNTEVKFNDSTTLVEVASAVDLYEEEKFYTVIGAGTTGGGGRQLIVLTDRRTEDPVNALVRVPNASQSLGTVDVYITAPGADISLVAPTINDLAFGSEIIDYTTLVPGDYQLRVTDPDDKDVRLSYNFTVAATEIETLAIVDAAIVGPQILEFNDPD